MPACMFAFYCWLCCVVAITPIYALTAMIPLVDGLFNFKFLFMQLDGFPLNVNGVIYWLYIKD